MVYKFDVNKANEFDSGDEGTKKEIFYKCL